MKCIENVALQDPSLEGFYQESTKWQYNPDMLHVPKALAVLVNNWGVEGSRRPLCGLLLRQQVTLQPTKDTERLCDASFSKNVLICGAYLPFCDNNQFTNLINEPRLYFPNRLSQWSKRRRVRWFWGLMPKVYWMGSDPTARVTKHRRMTPGWERNTTMCSTLTPDPSSLLKLAPPLLRAAVLLRVDIRSLVTLSHLKVRTLTSWFTSTRLAGR